MKNFILLYLLLVSTLIFSNEIIKKGNEADKMIKGAIFIRIKNELYAPNYIKFKEGKEPTVDKLSSFFEAYFYKRDVNYSFKILREEKDELGYNHLRIIHSYKNVPIEGSEYIIHIKSGKIKSMNGYFMKVQNLFNPVITETQAINIARNQTQSKKIIETTEPIKLVYTSTDLANIYSAQVLCYKIDVYSELPLFRNYVYVNAQNGEVVKLTDRIHEINANGTAITAYRGSRTIQTDSISPTLCLLHDHSRGQGIHTKNMQTGSDYSNAAEFTDTDNFWNNVNPEKDQYATDAHWGAAKTYDFMQQFGRNSIDNNGHPLNLFVHYGSNYVNAFWDGDKMTFGDGSGIYQPLTSLDITAHEIAHGLTQFSAGLVYAFEPGAINESFSDIFGNAVEYFADSLTYNWNIGEDIGGAFRSMSNPNSFDHPDTYLGTYWYTGSGDNGGVHTNSGVQNFWYFLLTIGGSGTNDIGNTYSVSGIGRNKANAITWRNLTVYLTSQSDYSDARFYSIQSAVDLYGSCSAEVASTTNAWYAVGVGNPYVNEVIADFTVSSNQGCNVPFNVSFNNNTANGVSYLWDFGDGQTSTNISPNHTYTSLGTYTVTLYANGGSCGLDTFISQNLISIDSTNLCTILMPDYGQAPMQTACEGRLIDDSGSDFYSDNINSSITIAPPGAAGVMLVFRQFKTEPTYDYLYVHEGYNTSGFLLEALTGSTIPDTIFVFSPAVTLRFYSDQFIVDSGFVMDWYCIQPIMQPTSFFKAKDSSSCRGYIEFSDLSTGGVDSWFWDFGDGNFSTDQNPGHLYSQPGTYTVSLIVSNSFGSDTFVKLNYINININPLP